MTQEKFNKRIVVNWAVDLPNNIVEINFSEGIKDSITKKVFRRGGIKESLYKQLIERN